MIEINKLYGILLGAAENVSDDYKWYLKKFTPIATNEKIQNILKVLLVTVSPDKRAFFACIICNAVLHTIFGKEIEERDPVNTYKPVERPNEDHFTPGFCITDLAASSDSYKALKQYLDEDIETKLATASWIDYIAAGCLQILRELDK